MLLQGIGLNHEITADRKASLPSVDLFHMINKPYSPLTLQDLGCHPGMPAKAL